MRCIAHDNGNPPRSATAIVYVTVVRNFFAPQWDQTNYEIRIQETQAMGIPFTKVSAKDQDRAAPNNRFFYEAVGDTKALQYFEVDEASGDVSVRKSLLTDTSKLYRFAIVSKDRGTPQLTSDRATVTIQVVRNDNAPNFDKNVYTASINQNQNTGQRVAQVKAEDADPEVCIDL